MITRKQWASQFMYCMWCGWSGYNAKYLLDCHEICGGVNRQKALLDPACWLRVCGERSGRTCHDEMSRLSKAKQMALKFAFDKGHYSLEAFLLIWRPRCTDDFKREFAEEVSKEVRLIMDESGAK